MRHRTPPSFSAQGRRILPLALTALTTLTVAAGAAHAQTPPPAAPPAATANLVTKADLQATGARLGQRVAAQTEQIAALRQQLLALKARTEALDRRVNGLKVPPAPAGPRTLLGR